LVANPMNGSRVICFSYKVCVLGVADLRSIHLKRLDGHGMSWSFLSRTSLASHQESTTIDRDQIGFSFVRINRRWSRRWIWAGSLFQHQISSGANASEHQNQDDGANDQQRSPFALWRREVHDHLLLCRSSRSDLSGVCGPVRIGAAALHPSLL